MSQPLDIIIVEKLGNLKQLSIKDYKEEELFKKCGFKKSEDFIKQHEWKVKTEGKKYIITVYGKTDGRANNENKYDFPPPLDSTLFFGNCAIIAKLKDENKITNLSLELWNKIYEKLFGGFEDLAATAKEDEEEIDELESIPAEKKTKNGYLKDGFVVDSSDTEEEIVCSDEESDEIKEDSNEDEDEDEEDDIDELEDIGSELSEESYDYDSDEEIKL
jgi:hypothetical protein